MRLELAGEQRGVVRLNLRSPLELLQRLNGLVVEKECQAQAVKGNEIARLHGEDGEKFAAGVFALFFR